MGSTPNAFYLKPGAAIIVPPAPGAPPITARPGDAVCHPSGAGYHVCIVAHDVPVGGLPLGASGDHFHWSAGPSYSGQGIPPTANANLSYDQTVPGAAGIYGSDGRISGNGATGKPSF